MVYKMAQPVSAVAQRNRYSQPYDFDALFTGADWRRIGSVSLKIIAMTQLIRVILGVINFSHLRAVSWFNPNSLFLFNNSASLSELQNIQPLRIKPVDNLVRRLSAYRLLDVNEIRLGAMKFRKVFSGHGKHRRSLFNFGVNRTLVKSVLSYCGLHARRLWLGYGLVGTAARPVNLAPYGRSLSSFDAQRNLPLALLSKAEFVKGPSVDFLNKRLARRFLSRNALYSGLFADRGSYRPIDSRRAFTSIADDYMLFAKNRAYRKLRKIMPLSFMRTKTLSKPNMWVKRLKVRLSKRDGILSAINNYNNRSLLRGDLDSVSANSARNIQHLRTIETYFGPIVLIGLRVKSRRRFF